MRNVSCIFSLLIMWFVVCIGIGGAFHCRVGYSATEPIGETVEPVKPVILQLDKILKKDVDGWLKHLASHEGLLERRLAIYCLGDFGVRAAKAVPVLIAEAKKSLDPESRRLAVEGLGMIGSTSKPARPMLLKALRNRQHSTKFRRACCEALVRIDPGSEEVRKAILLLVRSPEPMMRKAGINASVVLLYAGSPDPILEAMSRAIRMNKQSRTVVLALLCMGPRGEALLIESLERVKNPEAKVAVLEGIRRLGSKGWPARKALLRLAKGGRFLKTSVDVQREAMRALGAIHATNSEHLAIFFDHLGAKTLSATAEKLLSRAGTAALAGMASILTSGSPEKQSAAIRVLQNFGTSALDLSKELVPLITANDVNVAIQVVNLFNSLGRDAGLITTSLREADRKVTDKNLKEQLHLAIFNTGRPLGINAARSHIEALGTSQLIKLLDSQKDSRIRVAAVRALRGKSKGPHRDQVGAALRHAVDDHDLMVRAQAAKGLALFEKQAKELIPLLLDWLGSGESILQETALVVFASLPGKNRAVLTAVIDYIKATKWARDSSLRKKVGHVLRVQGPDAGQWLAEVFKEEDAKVRERAGLALAAMGPVGLIALPTLLKVADEDESDEVAQAALQAVASFGAAAEQAVPVLVKLCYHSKPVRRMATGWALAGIGVKDINADRHHVVDTLMINLLDTDERVARSAHIALTKIGRPTLPKLRDALRVGKGEAPYWALRVMARLRADPEVVIPRMLRLTLPGMLPIERGVAAELLGNYAPEHIEMIPVLVSVLGDRESYVVHAAERTLRLFGDRCVAELANVLKSPNKRLRMRALALLEELER